MAFTVNRRKYQDITFSRTLQGFSLIDKKLNEKIELEKFPKQSDDQCEWRLDIYPNGRNDRSKDYVSVFLTCIFNGTNSVVACSSQSFCDKNNKILKKSTNYLRKYRNNQGWVIDRFIKRDELLSHLIDDVLIVNCTVKWEMGFMVFNDTLDKRMPLVESYVQANLCNDFHQLMEKYTLSDVNLVTIDGTKFPAHKCILAARSSVFVVMFQHDMEVKKESIVNIKDVSSKVLGNMLQFIYTTKFDEKKCDIKELLAAADKYDINDLKVLCEGDLIEKLNVENAVEYLILAEQYKAQALKYTALTFIANNLSVVRVTAAMKNLSSTLPHLLNDIIEAITEKEYYERQQTSTVLTPGGVLSTKPKASTLDIQDTAVGSKFGSTQVTRPNCQPSLVPMFKELSLS